MKFSLARMLSDIGDVEENEVADARDILCDRIEEYIVQFEKDVFLEKLTEMLKEKVEEFLLEK